jgi:hypothetical protein
MRLSNLILAAGLAAAAAAQESPLDEYWRYLSNAEITSPNATTRVVDFANTAISWGLPPNASSPSNVTRFDGLWGGQDLYLVYMYRADEDDGSEDPQHGRWSTTSIMVGTMASALNRREFGAEWWHINTDTKAWLEKLVEVLGDRTGWEEVGDLRGGERFKFRWHVTPYYADDNDDVESMEEKVMESSWFDIDGVEGYTPGQEGAGSAGGRVELPRALLAVAAVAAAWVL